jgi:uncharacterized Zn finger protein (UPF0148 family)
MNRHNEVCCEQCGVPLFFIPENYTMGIKVLCINCGKEKKTKKIKQIKTAAANYAKTKKGIRKDIHPTYMFRSATEANVARILQYIGASWTFEERSFTFNEYKNGPFVYIMDFQINKIDHRKENPGFKEGFLEVKGWMNSASRQKLRRLKKNFPEEAKKTMVVIYDKYRKKDIEFCKKYDYDFMFFDELTKAYSNKIIGWE